MKPDFSNIEVEDSSQEWSGNSNISIKEIALAQYRDTCKEGSKEMARAGSKRKMTRSGVVVIDVDNQREIFFNSVTMLKITLMPYLKDKENKKYKESIEKIEQEIEGITKNYQKYIMSLQEKEKNLKNGSIASYIYENLKDQLELAKVDLARKILTQLSLLLAEENYLGEATA